MHNCIYSAHCTQAMCDKSCPTLAETSYLLERNNISMSSDVFRRGQEAVDKYSNILTQAEGKLKTVITGGNCNFFTKCMMKVKISSKIMVFNSNRNCSTHKTPFYSLITTSISTKAHTSILIASKKPSTLIISSG